MEKIKKFKVYHIWAFDSDRSFEYTVSPFTTGNFKIFEIQLSI